MNYDIHYGGMVIESFSSYSDREAKKFAMARYTHFEKVTDESGNIICTKVKKES